MRCRPADPRPIDGHTAVDELTSTSHQPAIGHYDQARDEDAVFRNLVQSPLRAGLLRFLSARPAERFDLDSLMSTFGRMRLDVENCLRELVEFGVVRRVPSSTPTYLAHRPQRQPAARQLDVFLERQAAVSSRTRRRRCSAFARWSAAMKNALVVLFVGGISVEQVRQRRSGCWPQHARLHVRKQLLARVDDVEMTHGELTDAILRRKWRIALLHR